MDSVYIRQYSRGYADAIRRLQLRNAELTMQNNKLVCALHESAKEINSLREKIASLEAQECQDCLELEQF